LWGIKSFNDILSSAGPFGYVQSEILFKKDKSTFTVDQDGRFQREFISMVIVVLCLLLMYTPGCQMQLQNLLFLKQHGSMPFLLLEFPCHTIQI
jgi:hypothetical protein